MVVRPAGSAVVELVEPTSKIQKGPAVLQPYYPRQFEGIYDFAPSTIAPPFASTGAPNSNEESVVVENPDFRQGQVQEQVRYRGTNNECFPNSRKTENSSSFRRLSGCRIPR